DLHTRTLHDALPISLAAEGFCDQDAKTGRWLLGPELFLMGNIAGARYDVTELAQKHVHALAQQTEESAFFSTLRGNEAVCLVRRSEEHTSELQSRFD